MQRFLSLTAPQAHAREELRSDGMQTESPEHSAALSPATGLQLFDLPSYQHVVSALLHRDAAHAEQQLASADVALQAVPESDEPAAGSLDDGYLLMQSLVEPVAQEPRAETVTGTAIELELLAPTIDISN